MRYIHCYTACGTPLASIPRSAQNWARLKRDHHVTVVMIDRGGNLFVGITPMASQGEDVARYEYRAPA